MEKYSLGPEIEKAIEQVLGYLNFSSGLADPAFEQNLNQLWARLCDLDEHATWRTVGDLLIEKLGGLRRGNASFSDATQAELVLTAVCDHILPGYLKFHQNVLFTKMKVCFSTRSCSRASAGPHSSRDCPSRLRLSSYSRSSRD